jgi:Spy/CpxP family protein refolding chaperone
MRRHTAAVALALVVAGAAAPGHAAPIVPPQEARTRPAIVPVQGWWESERRRDRAREAYWRLPPPALERYNRLEYEIRQLTAQRRELDERIERARREQHELLGFRGW